ncbi:MAG: low specificity L-threonine aldolase [Planctomycetes bacterium]|nr:low specificity L-threonine aldolase [Planctomycetota bacterium]
MQPAHSFASDNNAPVHPAVLEAITAANAGHVRAYGDDPWTRAMEERFRAHFGPGARAFPVFNGTGANVTGLSALLRPYEAVICAEHAHASVDECGAPERFLGSKLLLVRTDDGKLKPADVVAQLRGLRDQHHVQPKVVSITQSTEVGTVYAPDELAALAHCTREHGLFLHVDGARIANAAASLSVPLRAITTDVGVDVLSFGGTKNGALAAEAVVFLRPGLGEEFQFLRKQGMQLASKMRFVSAQLARLLEDDLWLSNAAHANSMARRLAERVRGIPGVELAHPVQANGVFARIPRACVAPLQASSYFYVWDEAGPVVRWMCSYDTRAEDVDAFAGALRALAQGSSAASAAR